MGQIGPVPGSNSWLYRVSKAALNMAVSSARFDHPKATLVALDPGWVQTDMGGAAAPLTPEASVRGLRAVLANLQPADNGRLIHHDGHRATTW
jgi:NAD(P)-dependent dehydrogenase (short-subunit alcohol dehydrogenase family)